MFLLKKNYFLYLSNFFMILGVLLGLNSMNWLMMWVSMEITLMFFIPSLILNKSMLESFSSLKYFIFQCLGSIFFILGSMDFFYFNTFGLLLKLSIFPNHFWMFMVCKGLNWKNFFFIMTVQKTLPLFFIIISFNYTLMTFVFLLFLNSFLGNLGSLNQMDIRFLMIFSSMSHMTWMIMSSMLNMFYFIYYFFLYISLNFYLFKIFNKINIYYLYQVFLMKNYNLNIFILLMFIVFFSFMGFPPLMGFFMKLITLLSLFLVFINLFMFLLLMQNLIITYSYMRMVIFFFFNLTRTSKFNKFYFNKYFFFYMFFFFFFM
uniref:NADH-ubiquinone oxidoreductase chain 2 n=1 Tax=Haplothrips aculeatus TaxID=450991 RepID=A0A0H3VL99_9NEOP|nr:NADH dehydrogenase subunit 2 [Haplothrips aculeatus]AKE35840.1 NADH dehydrogenase subunit 2 [Haplothrips aculeatus]